jgi:vanillate/3-O-methylgallate O-demethylase
MTVQGISLSVNLPSSGGSPCYIHTGLSGLQFRFEGPDVAKFFASICSNSFAKFPVGSMKHGVMCNDEGLVATHGILQRNAEEEYRWFAAGPWRCISWPRPLST